MALRGTLVKKKLAPNRNTSSTVMRNVPTGPTLPPSAVSNPGWILSGSPVLLPNPILLLHSPHLEDCPHRQLHRPVVGDR